MHVWWRINARKVVLSYFYQCCFFLWVKKNNVILKDVLSSANTYTMHDDFDEHKTNLENDILTYVHDDPHAVITYILEHYYDKRMQEIDTEYLFAVWPAFHTYHEEIEQAVNTYTTSFSYDKMDYIDQALFLLWYVEWKVLKTPKEILLNELVELSKRYADTGSSKLINGIMHRILTEE